MFTHTFQDVTVKFSITSDHAQPPVYKFYLLCMT